MNEDPSSSCPVSEGVIIRGSDGKVYQINMDDLQSYRVDRDDEHMRSVRSELDKLSPARSNYFCVHGKFESLVKPPPCCAKVPQQIEDALKHSS